MPVILQPNILPYVFIQLLVAHALSLSSALSLVQERRSQQGFDSTCISTGVFSTTELSRWVDICNNSIYWRNNVKLQVT